MIDPVIVSVFDLFEGRKGMGRGAVIYVSTYICMYLAAVGE